MKRAALYTRVSTDDQAKDGFSLDAQIEKLRAYAKIHDWTISSEYVDDGHSGRTVKRPAYARMLNESDSWDTILVLKMDRIHRSSRNFMTMVDSLKKQGKEFTSVMENLDTATAMGRFVMDIVVRIAQLESEQNGERVLISMEQKAKMNGGSLGRPPPFGYRYQDHKLVPVPEEAKIVRKIFTARRRRKQNYTSIAVLLNDAGHTTRNGGPWTYWNVCEIAKSQTYYGHLKWKGIMQLNQHEAIVEA